MSHTELRQSSISIKRSGVHRIIQVVVLLCIQAAVLFAAAGTLNWLRAWAYIGMNVALLMVNMVVLFRVNPEVINQRGKIKSDTKKFDKVISVMCAPLPFIMLVIAGFDAVRFQWSSMSGSLAIVGVAVLVSAQFLFLWAMAVNVYFETSVRIQKDRDQHVVASGPYQFVRHPGYVGFILMHVGTPLFLGSWWAFVPVFLMVILVVIRTALEDLTLHNELPGYTEYAHNVRYRLLPGVW